MQSLPNASAYRSDEIMYPLLAFKDSKLEVGMQNEKMGSVRASIAFPSYSVQIAGTIMRLRKARVTYTTGPAHLGQLFRLQILHAMGRGRAYP